MGNFWLKVKVWSKGIIFALMVLYALVFLLMNMGQEPVTLWFWYKTQLRISPLLLVFITFLVGAAVAILLRTTLTTVRQIQELRARSRAERMEREMADMKQKAAMLQTRPQARQETDESEPTS